MTYATIDGYRQWRANKKYEIAKINATVASALITNKKASFAIATTALNITNDDIAESIPSTAKSPAAVSMVVSVDVRSAQKVCICLSSQLQL